MVIYKRKVMAELVFASMYLRTVKTYVENISIWSNVTATNRKLKISWQILFHSEAESDA